MKRWFGGTNGHERLFLGGFPYFPSGGRLILAGSIRANLHQPLGWTATLLGAARHCSLQGRNGRVEPHALCMKFTD
jgi:hypothetical protein